MISFKFHEVLQMLNQYKNGNIVFIDENAEDGKAELELSSHNLLFAISLSNKNRIKVFKHQQVADWIVIEFMDNEYSNINLHIIEIKRTITESSWSKTKLQFKGGLEHSFLLKGLFDYKIKNIYLYTAYVNVRLHTTNTTNPALLKSTVGTYQQTSSVDWNNSQIHIDMGTFNHKKIELSLNENIAKGSYRLEN